jgi:hypothetical protein
MVRNYGLPGCSYVSEEGSVAIRPCHRKTTLMTRMSPHTTRSTYIRATMHGQEANRESTSPRFQ